MKQIIYLYYRLKVFTEGYGIKSKLCLLLNAFIRVPLFVVGGSSPKFSYIADKYLPEVTIKNKDRIARKVVKIFGLP